LNSFTWPLIEEVHADIFSSLDDYAQANFIKVTQVRNLDAKKPILGFQVAKPVKDEKSKETYVPAEHDIILMTSQKPWHVSDLTQNKASFVLGSVLESEDGFLLPGWCVVQLSSTIPIEEDCHTKIPKGPFFFVFLINMKTYNRIWRCILLGQKNANLDELQNSNSSGPMNKVWQFKPRLHWSYARKVSSIPYHFESFIFLISAFILGLEIFASQCMSKLLSHKASGLQPPAGFP